MCFRPAAIELDKKCPECGATNSPDGIVCSECGAKLPSGPALPGAPKAPGAPGALKPPGAPGSPKPPGV